MTEVLIFLNEFLWGIPVLILIIGVGLYLSITTGFAQIRLFPKSMKVFIERFKNKDSDNCEISSYQALCTALAATVGTGNLAGVAGAIAIGGPGAIFWMWICAFLGMIIKFSEATLAVYYRHKNMAGDPIGGPMYMIRNGLGQKYHPLSVLYCTFGIVASFGIGNATQVNTVIGSLNSISFSAGYDPPIIMNLILGCVLAVIIGTMLSGGAKRIGRVTELLVPLAAGLYILICFGVLLFRHQQIPKAFQMIFAGAFSPSAVTGGILGSAFQTMRIGVSRGVFTNEAGMGTASIAHASANVKNPIEQGFMGIVEVFLDTIVICTLTALVILCSGVQIPFGTDCGIALTIDSFSSVYGNWIGFFITIAVILFAFATILGWSLYGVRCVEYLFGDWARKYYVVMQMVMVIVGSVLNVSMVWTFSEITNGLMAIPNLIALVGLSPKLIKLINDYK